MPHDPLEGLSRALEEQYPGITQKLNDPDHFKMAAVGRRLPMPNLPSEFSQIPGKIARMGLPESFGPYARAADEITTGAKNAIGSVGPAAEFALDALRRYVAKMF